MAGTAKNLSKTKPMPNKRAWDLPVVLDCFIALVTGYSMQPADLGTVLMVVALIAFCIHVMMRQWAPEKIMRLEGPVLFCSIILTVFVAWAVSEIGATREMLPPSFNSSV